MIGKTMVVFQMMTFLFTVFTLFLFVGYSLLDIFITNLSNKINTNSDPKLASLEVEQNTREVEKSKQSIEEQLIDVKSLFDKGLINEVEYSKIKERILKINNEEEDK